ncbi:MAG: recombinase family protein, partial [Frankiaceae bacterium]|nr:recombinase family protein [Frankiaceae bacterium]
MTRLPRSIDELAGLRAARWIRESTAGQVDRFGPDAQREHQNRAIERYGLVDTGLAWQVAHSGRTIATTSQWADMLAGAGTSWDVLVVGYVSRFARDLRTAVNARHDLHAAGGAILFADERLLTSDEEAWETWAREAVEAEAYSRRLGKRIREGYAAKRRRLQDPGGNAPYGFRRGGPERTLEVEPETIERVQRIFELAAAGATDREVSLQSVLPLPTVRGILRNPIYAGRLEDGTPTRFAAPIAQELWQAATQARDRRRRQRGRRAIRRAYALTMLRCAVCDRRLVGDNQRYRHLELCPAFAAAAANGRRRRPGQHRIPVGASYPAETYEAAVGALLRRVAVGADVAVNVL